MDKTEVTNGEYENFVRETNHEVPAHWPNGRIVAGEENQPVVRVSYYDVEAFAKWRSKRDSVDYRLPTEEEWEYAARNGAAGNIYPWGDRWEDERAVIGKTSIAAVGTYSRGANKWGVQDLIGNVWEWTSSKIRAYPGSNVGFSKPEDYVIRGGSFNSSASGDKAITSTFRNDVSPDRKDGLLGFRLVRSN
jgi:formylglycine-generating enzyme required for sulfatase activity